MSADASGSADLPPPYRVAAWSLGLRFLLELAALAGLALLGLAVAHGATGVVLAVLLPLAGAAAWGTFAVPNEPYRNPSVPVAVSGPVRFTIEVIVLLGGIVGYVLGTTPTVGLVVLVLVVIQALSSIGRLRWLLAQPGP